MGILGIIIFIKVNIGVIILINLRLLRVYK